MECIVLVGGRGTRLQSKVSDRPKPMASIADKPFLQWQLDYLIDRGVKRIILATGYMGQYIEVFFGAKYREIPIVYSEEVEPLGTGGAIKKALSLVHSDSALVTNGDTYCEIDLASLFLKETEISMALVSVPSVERYGSVLVSDHDSLVVSFLPKDAPGAGLINAGTYRLNKNKFLARKLPEKFSFESDYLPSACLEKCVAGIAFAVPFIDIGVPQDFEKAQTYIPELALIRNRLLD